MSVKMEYKQQVDALCKGNVKVTGEELLLLAKEGNKGESAKERSRGENLVQFTTRQQSHFSWKQYAMVACIIVVCSLALTTTALAATGMLGDVLRKIFKDETSAQLVEDGFVYVGDQSGTDGIFRVDFIGVTGDKSVPKMFFDVYVEDTELAEDYDEIGLWVSTYETREPGGEEIEIWSPAYGTKDAENQNLYHVVREGGTVRRVDGRPVRVVVTNVIFNPNQMDMVDYEVNIEFSMDVPSTALHSATMEDYGGRRIDFEDTYYYLTYITYGVYHTEFDLSFDYDGVSFEGQYSSPYGLENILRPYYKDFISQVTFVVDGVEYKVIDNEDGYGYIWYDESGESGVPKRCYVHPRFPAVDYENAKDIRILSGGKEYRLK
ncbi:MAG: hypothetical protein IJZ55_12465 [Lachnospiraceae bacterium]|nr:hypothetical protein [Lachnospiraceae bacterium]